MQQSFEGRLNAQENRISEEQRMSHSHSVYQYSTLLLAASVKCCKTILRQQETPVVKHHHKCVGEAAKKQQFSTSGAKFKNIR